MSTREDFAAALATLREGQAEFMSLGPEHPLYAELDELLLRAGGKRLALAKRAHSGHVDLVKAKKILGEDALNALVAPLKARGEALCKAASAKIDLAKEALSKLAGDPEAPRWLRLTARPEAPDEDVRARGLPGLVVETVGPWAYSSQTSAEHYARVHAERAALRIRFYDVRAKVVRVGEPKPSFETLTGRPSTYRSLDFVVRAWVEDETDVELLKRLPGPGLREEVRVCWSMGVQPRVFNSFLPYGYEEQNGLDYFGHDLRAEKCPKCGQKHEAHVEVSRA